MKIMIFVQFLELILNENFDHFNAIELNRGKFQNKIRLKFHLNLIHLF